MIRTLSLATALASALALAAMAQDTRTIPSTGVTTVQMAPQPAAAGGMTLTEQEGKSWIDKPIYSSDGKKIGDVVAIQRDASNKVLGLHAGMGGFLGMMQTRVSVTPEHFKLQTDRVVLDMTAEQAKALPKVQS